MTIFHLAIPSHDLDLSKSFYTGVFGADIGREYPGYIIFNFFGHQLVAHHNPEAVDEEPSMYPRHYGIILDNKENFDRIYNRCVEIGAKFFQELFERFVEKDGWHFSFFITDPSNNTIEFKYYVNKQDIFS